MTCLFEPVATWYVEYLPLLILIPRRLLFMIMSAQIAIHPQERIEGPTMKTNLTTKQKRDRRWKIKRRKQRRQKTGL